MHLFRDWWHPAYPSWKLETQAEPAPAIKQHVSREEEELQVSVWCCAAPRIQLCIHFDVCTLAVYRACTMGVACMCRQRLQA